MLSGFMCFWRKFNEKHHPDDLMWKKFSFSVLALVLINSGAFGIKILNNSDKFLSNNSMSECSIAETETTASILLESIGISWNGALIYLMLPKFLFYLKVFW